MDHFQFTGENALACLKQHVFELQSVYKGDVGFNSLLQSVNQDFFQCLDPEFDFLTHSIESIAAMAIDSPKEFLEYQHPTVESWSWENETQKQIKYFNSKGSMRRLNHKAILILTEWLLNHKDNPYPSLEEKQYLAGLTDLTATQVSNWMTNTRKRHVLPILRGTKPPRKVVHFAFLQDPMNDKRGNVKKSRASVNQDY